MSNAAKMVTEFVISTGAGALVATVAKANLPASASGIRKGIFWIGSFALSQFIGDVTAKHFTDQIDETVVAMKGVASEIRAAQEAAKKDDTDGES